MAEPRPVFAILWALPSQRPAIDAYCFGSCGKIIVGAIEILLGDTAATALLCREMDCPAGIPGD